MRRLRRHARLLAAGTRLLLRQYRGWLLPGPARTALARIGGSLLGGGFAATVLHRAPVLMWFVTGWWVIAAWRAARVVERARAADAAFLQLLTDAIGDRNGVLLRQVLALLHREKMLTDWTITDLRAACDRLGVPVRDSVWVDGDVSVGVKRVDLHAAYPILTPVDQQPLPQEADAPTEAPRPAGHEATRPRVEDIGGGAAWSIHTSDDGGTAAEPLPAAKDFEAHLDDALSLLDPHRGGDDQ